MAVTVMEFELPAVMLEAIPVTVRVEAEAGLTTIEPSEPVIELVTVSVAVTL